MLIEWAGDDPNREGLIDTPGRVARSYCELFAGYAAEPRDYLKRTFEEVGGYDELVVLRDIRVPLTSSTVLRSPHSKRWKSTKPRPVSPAPRENV